MLDCAARLAKAMQDLVNATKLVMTNPNDPEAHKALAAAIRNLEQISAEAAALALSPDDQMLDANAEMASALSHLKAALIKGDREGVEAALNDATNAVKRQLFLAKPLANNMSDPAQKVRLLFSSLGLLKIDILGKIIGGMQEYGQCFECFERSPAR